MLHCAVQGLKGPEPGRHCPGSGLEPSPRESWAVPNAGTHPREPGTKGEAVGNPGLSQGSSPSVGPRLLDGTWEKTVPSWPLPARSLEWKPGRCCRAEEGGAA